MRQETTEPLLPKIPLRWLIGLVTFCSVAFEIIRRAIVFHQPWAMMGTIVLASLLVPILFYLLSFFLASLYCLITSAILGQSLPGPVYHPTKVMPTSEPDLTANNDTNSEQT